MLFRPHAVSAPRRGRSERLPELHSEVAVTLGRGPRVPPRSTAGGSRGSRCPQGRRGLREHSPIWVCFSFPLRWRPGSPRSACCSGPHWGPRCRLPLPTPPPRAAPSFSGPVTCAPQPHLSSTEEAPRGGPAAPRRFGSTSPWEGVCLSREQQISGPRDSGIPGTPDATRRCHYSAPGQALPLSSCNYHYRRRPQGGV